MISRRFLLGAAPAALVAHNLPAPDQAFTSSTWGVGTAELDLAYGRSVTAWAAVRAGYMTVAEVRAAEGLPAFDLMDLLR